MKTVAPDHDKQHLLSKQRAPSRYSDTNPQGEMKLFETINDRQSVISILCEMAIACFSVIKQSSCKCSGERIGAPEWRFVYLVKSIRQKSRSFYYINKLLISYFFSTSHYESLND